MPEPRVSVVIINWNCYQDTLECVAALKKSTYANLEVIVVDNASTDGSAEKVERDIPGIILIKSPQNLGWAGGSNLGAQDAFKRGAEYLLLLNADAFVEPDTVERLVRKAESSPDIGLVSAVIYFFKSRQLQHCGAEIDWEACTVKESKELNDADKIPPERFWVWGTAVLIKRKVIETIGFYEEKYFCYCEDQEYSMRAHRAGFGIAVAKDAQTFHRCHEVDIGGRKNMPLYFYFYLTRNDFFFFKKYDSSRFHFYRKFLAKILVALGDCKAKGQDHTEQKIIDAYLDGLYCGFKNLTGRWDTNRHMPRWIKMVMMSHPYLGADILNGNFRKVFKAPFNRNRHAS